MTEALDVDLAFEAPIYISLDVESSSESEYDHDSEHEDATVLDRQPKMGRFMKNHTINCGTVGTSWEHRKPPTELQALNALDKIRGLL